MTANAAIHGLRALYDEWVAGREHHPGKTPLAKLTGVKPETSGGGAEGRSTIEPQFAIAKWVKIPHEFETPLERSAAAPNGSAAADAYTAAKGGRRRRGARQGPTATVLPRKTRASGAEGGSRERAPAPLGSRRRSPRGRPRAAGRCFPAITGFAALQGAADRCAASRTRQPIRFRSKHGGGNIQNALIAVPTGEAIGAWVLDPGP